MGEVFARTVLGIDKPTIGLLNVGVEALKGSDEVREAAAILKETSLPIEFMGFVEGDDIPAGTVDVIVTDGFTGNIALKTAEGMTKLYTSFLKDAFSSSLSAKIGYLFIRRALNNLAPADGSSAVQRRNVVGFERNCRQKSWRHGQRRICQRDRCWRRYGATRLHFKIKQDFERLKDGQNEQKKAAVS